MMMSIADEIEYKLKDAITTAASIGACCHIERDTIIGMLNAMWDIAERELDKLTAQTQEKQHDNTDDKEATERTDGNDTKSNPTV